MDSRPNELTLGVLVVLLGIVSVGDVGPKVIETDLVTRDRQKIPRILPTSPSGVAAGNREVKRLARGH